MNDDKIQQFRQKAIALGHNPADVDRFISTKRNIPSTNQGGAVQPASVGISGNYADLIKKNFSPDQWNNAYRVMMGESGGRSDAVGDNFPIRGETIPSVGLFQIRTLPGRPSAEQLSDPEFNVRYAAQMQKTQGWKPWTAARKLGIK